MLFRSTNSKFTHFQGDILSNVDDGSSHGVQLTGGSTGGIVQPCGDDTDIALTVRGKGAGAVNLTSSGTFTQTSTQIVLSSTRVNVGSNSTTPVSGIQRYVVQFTPPAVEASSWTDLSTITVSGLATNSGLFPSFRTLDIAPSTLGSYSYEMACSTAGELKIRANNHSGSTLSAQATSRFILTEIKFG